MGDGRLIHALVCFLVHVWVGVCMISYYLLGDYVKYYILKVLFIQMYVNVIFVKLFVQHNLFKLTLKNRSLKELSIVIVYFKAVYLFMF